jgi:chromosome segregation ATPase
MSGEARRLLTNYRRKPWERHHDHMTRLLVHIAQGQEKIMADLSALEAELAEVKSSAEAAQAAVLVALEGFKAQIADLMAQIDALGVGAVTQEQIDALTVAATEIDTTVDAITAAATPA